MRRRTGLLVTAAGILVVWAAAAIGQSGGTTPTGTARPSEVRPLADRVQNYDRVNEEKSSWGSLRWLMNSKLDPGSGITLGVVELFAGESNPLHVHSNSDEVIYMLSGMGEHRVGRQTVILKAGDTLRIPAGTPHTAKALGKEPMRSVVVYNTGERQFTVVNENGAK
jgi:quercetin dioxygenase-like cupin family protein